MSRARTSELLKRAYEAGDREAALALLEQSIALGHRRAICAPRSTRVIMTMYARSLRA
jgi:hypothetical protein